MKRLLTYAIVSVVLTSCWDDSYRGRDNSDENKLNSAFVKVSVGGYEEIGTKGSGAIDSEEDMLWKNDSVYVYSFIRDAASFTALSSESDYEDADPPVCLIDGSRDKAGAKGGKLARMADLEFLRWDKDDNRLRYPGGIPDGMTPYSFYAYYVDDFKLDDSSIRRTDDSIVVPVEIDGSRDIMTAVTRLTEDQLAGAELTKEERLEMHNYAYSSYSANINIHPQIYFRHHLARLTFELYPGISQCDGVYVQKIEVKSKTTGELTVVHKNPEKIAIDFSSRDDSEYFSLKEDDGKTEMKRDHYMLKWHDDFNGVKDVYKRPKVAVNGSLLVAPDTEYEWIVHMKGMASNGIVVERVIDEIAPLTCEEGSFVGGKQYVVRLAIYGVGEIGVNVTTNAWGYGGDIIVDGEEWGQ